MNKIPTVFVRDYSNPQRPVLTDEVNPAAAWVFEPGAVATRKYDGTCVMLDEHGAWWARREVKPGKTPPPNYRPVTTDATTGKTMGWEPIGASPFQKAFREAILGLASPEPGTYELIGPKINGNPEQFDRHALLKHGASPFYAGQVWTPAEARRVVTALGGHHVEGLVWHHPDGRMAKLKARDLEPIEAAA